MHQQAEKAISRFLNVTFRLSGHGYSFQMPQGGGDQKNLSSTGAGRVYGATSFIQTFYEWQMVHLLKLAWLNIIE